MFYALDPMQKHRCTVIGNMLAKAYVVEIDCYALVEILLTTEYGIMVMEDRRMIEYADAGYMLEGFQWKFELLGSRGYEGDSDFMMKFAGFLYKYWLYVGSETCEEIYRLAPLELILRRFDFYHTQGYDYVIEDLKERPYDWVEDVDNLKDREKAKVKPNSRL